MYSDEDDCVEEFKPDRSKTDYYCNVCDSHMNSLQMWESHIAGKRHLKNMKKEVGEPPSKVKAIRKEGAMPLVQERLNATKEPVVGLAYVCEIQKVDLPSDPMYTCYLCHANTTKSGIIEHLTSTKHRLNFFKEASYNTYELITSMHLGKSAKEGIVTDTAREWERDNGRDIMEVKVQKSKLAPPLPMKRSWVPDHGDSHRPSKRLHQDDSRAINTSVSSVHTAPSPAPPVAGVPRVEPTPSTSHVADVPAVVVPIPRKLDLKEDFKCLPDDEQLDVIQSAAEDASFSTCEQQQIAQEIMRVVVQAIVQSSIRSASREQKKRLVKDVESENAPFANFVIDCAIKGKKNYYLEKNSSSELCALGSGTLESSGYISLKF